MSERTSHRRVARRQVRAQRKHHVDPAWVVDDNVIMLPARQPRRRKA